jgi:malate dehydrogenase (oxaloacetate-decarboxylating)(NADP+)
MRETARNAGVELNRNGIEIINARLSRRNAVYADHLYEKMQRKGFLFRDCQRLINNDRNHFAATMVALGDADAVVSGVTRNYSTCWRMCAALSMPSPAIGWSACPSRCAGRTVIVADTAVHDMPNAEQIADIAEEAAGFARRMGYEPRVALLASSTFGHPYSERSERVLEAVRILDKRRVDFEYDGEMGADVALNHNLMQHQYPFCRLSGAANVLVMPAFHSASISTKMLQELGGSTVIGPLLVGLNKPVQIVPLNAKDSDIVNMAAIAAYTAGT